MITRIGVIEKVLFGNGGYQGAMLGLTLIFKFDGSMGITGFVNGGWTIERNDCAKWTEADRTKQQSELCWKLIETLKKAKVDDVYELKGKPVELVLDKGSLHSWRILEEAIL